LAVLGAATFAASALTSGGTAWVPYLGKVQNYIESLGKEKWQGWKPKDLNEGLAFDPLMKEWKVDGHTDVDAIPPNIRDTIFWDTAVKRRQRKRPKMEVLLLKDHDKLGNRGELVKVRAGYFRQRLLPEGIATRQDEKALELLRQVQAQTDATFKAALDKALAAKKKIEALGVIKYPKKVREGSTVIFGSLTPTNFAEKIIIETGIPIRIASVEVPKVTELGEYTGTIDLGTGVTVFVKFEVVDDVVKDDDDPKKKRK